MTAAKDGPELRGLMRLRVLAEHCLAHEGSVLVFMGPRQLTMRWLQPVPPPDEHPLIGTTGRATRGRSVRSVSSDTEWFRWSGDAH